MSDRRQLSDRIRDSSRLRRVSSKISGPAGGPGGIGLARKSACAIDHLEIRTLLSSSATIGPIAIVVPASSGDLESPARAGLDRGVFAVDSLDSGRGRDGPGDDRRGALRFQVPTANMGQLARRACGQSGRPVCRPAQTVSALTVPNDPDYTNGDEWQLNGTWGINVPGAWNVTTGSDQVIVADTDSGIAYNHPRPL